ncbi:hypothetical protein D3C85_1218770 [compost metagenome]
MKIRGILVKKPSMKETKDMMEVMYTFQLYALDHMETQGNRPDFKKLQECLDLQYEATEKKEYHLYVKYSM